MVCNSCGTPIWMAMYLPITDLEEPNLLAEVTPKNALWLHKDKHVPLPVNNPTNHTQQYVSNWVHTQNSYHNLHLRSLIVLDHSFIAHITIILDILGSVIPPLICSYIDFIAYVLPPKAFPLLAKFVSLDSPIYFRVLVQYFCLMTLVFSSRG